MPEQQKIDETIESITNKDKKKDYKDCSIFYLIREGTKFCCRE